MAAKYFSSERIALANLITVVLFSIYACLTGMAGVFEWYIVPIFIAFNVSLYVLSLVRYPGDSGFGLIFIFILLTQWLSLGMFILK